MVLVLVLVLVLGFTVGKPVFITATGNIKCVEIVCSLDKEFSEYPRLNSIQMSFRSQFLRSLVNAISPVRERRFSLHEEGKPLMFTWLEIKLMCKTIAKAID